MSKLEDESNGSDEEEYKVEAICNSTIYIIKSKSNQLPGLYYLIS